MGTSTSTLNTLGRRGVVAAVAAAATALVTRARPALADVTVPDNQIVNGFCHVRDDLRCGNFFTANSAEPFGGAPMVLRQIAGNNGVVITDQGGANRKDLFIGLDLTLNHTHIQGVQEGVKFLDTALNPSGGNVGIGTATPVTTLHVAGAEQVDSNLMVSGNLVVQGTKSRAVHTATFGTRELYAIEAPDNWFEDIGWAALRNGQARITFDPVFAETVNTHERYAVFLTALGDCNGLYVKSTDPNGFDVQELQGGRSSVEFQYRVIARALGVEQLRLETFTPPKR